MKTIKFTSLHGTYLTGKVFDEKNIKNVRISFIRMLGKIYAVTDGYSLDETDDKDDLKEFEKRLIYEI